MKKFSDFREQVIFNKKIDRIPVKIQKRSNKFVAYVDGDMLDTYSSEKEARKMAATFIKQYKG